MFTCCLYFCGALVLLLAAFKLYLIVTLGECKSKSRLDGKTVIVTGSNTGIGKETALDLAARGARVILACRNLEKATQARDDIILQTKNKNVVVRELDLASLKSVRKFAADILKSEAKIDVLINNAGCALLQKQITADGLDYQMQSNHFGHFLLTNLLLGKLLENDGARIINVSSEGHRFYRNLDLSNINFTRENSGQRIFEIYCTSKLCNVLFTRELNNKIRALGKKVTVNSLHPGGVMTEFSRFAPRWMDILQYPASFFVKTPKQGAQTTIYLAVADEVADVTGRYFSDCKVARESKMAQDDALAKKLWELSESLVGLKPEERYC